MERLPVEAIVLDFFPARFVAVGVRLFLPIRKASGAPMLHDSMFGLSHAARDLPLHYYSYVPSNFGGQGNAVRLGKEGCKEGDLEKLFWLY